MDTKQVRSTEDERTALLTSVRHPSLVRAIMTDKTHYTGKDHAVTFGLSAAAVSVGTGSLLVGMQFFNKFQTSTSSFIEESLRNNPLTFGKPLGIMGDTLDTLLNGASDLGLAAGVFAIAAVAPFCLRYAFAVAAREGVIKRVSPKAAIVGAITGLAIGVSSVFAFSSGNDADEVSAALQAPQAVKIAKAPTPI